jgi:hypothetical protein
MSKKEESNEMDIYTSNLIMAAVAPHFSRPKHHLRTGRITCAVYAMQGKSMVVFKDKRGFVSIEKKYRFT